VSLCVFVRRSSQDKQIYGEDKQTETRKPTIKAKTNQQAGPNQQA
jgi:hypothetical protein